MYRVYAIWTHPKPEDVEAFEKHYAEVHAPLAAAIPGVKKLSLIRTAETIGGTESPFHRIAEMSFEDRAAVDAALQTRELEVAAADAVEMEEKFGVQVLGPSGEEVDSPLGPYAPKS